MVDVTALCCDDEGEQRSMSSDDPACVWKEEKKKERFQQGEQNQCLHVCYTSNKRGGHNEGIDNYGTTTEQLRKKKHSPQRRVHGIVQGIDGDGGGA